MLGSFFAAVALPCPTPINETSRLAVGGGHELFVRIFGCQGGPAILFLHGGWGPLTSEASYDLGGLVDTNRYLVVYHHQRGWGQSTPLGSIANNELADNVEDCEAVRKAAGVTQWASVYGGSNGATLGLAYAASYPSHTCSVVLRGLWLIRESDVVYDYITLNGKARHYPDEWDRFAGAVGCGRSVENACAGLSLLERYRDALAAPDPAVSERAAASWLQWDALGATVQVPAGPPPPPLTPPLANAQLGVHLYLTHAADITTPIGGGRLLQTAAAALANMPIRLITGHYDMLCPPAMAYEVAGALRRPAALRLVAGAAHSAGDSSMGAEIREAFDELAGAAALGSAPHVTL